MLDGFVVEVGDSVWDILLALTGTVVATPGGGMFTVDFGSGKVLTYSSGGNIAGARRAYWLNPVMVIPRKAEQRWAAMTQAAIVVRDAP